jgi:hypothetical protein
MIFQTLTILLQNLMMIVLQMNLYFWAKLVNFCYFFLNINIKLLQLIGKVCF